MAYPTSVTSFTSRNAGDTIQPSHINDLQTEVAALETALLTTGLAHHLFPDATTRTLGTSGNPWGDTYVAATKKLYLDSGGDTYVWEETGNRITLVCGGTTLAQFDRTSSFISFPASDLIIGTTAKLYLDGGTNTYLHEASADTIEIVTGGTARLTISNSGLKFGTHAGIAAETVTGYITITDASGNARKLAVVS